MKTVNLLIAEVRQVSLIATACRTRPTCSLQEQKLSTTPIQST